MRLVPSWRENWYPGRTGPRRSVTTSERSCALRSATASSRRRPAGNSARPFVGIDVEGNAFEPLLRWLIVSEDAHGAAPPRVQPQHARAPASVALLGPANFRALLFDPHQQVTRSRPGGYAASARSRRSGLHGDWQQKCWVIGRLRQCRRGCWPAAVASTVRMLISSMPPRALVCSASAKGVRLDVTDRTFRE